MNYQILKDARKIADYSMPLLEGMKIPVHIPYNNVAATLSDAGLQAGLNYRVVVKPRINYMIENWSDINTTSKFIKAMSTYGLDKMLKWKNPDKLIRIQDMAQLMFSEGVETEDDLSHWIAIKNNGVVLQNIKGVGPKTVDYIKILVGIPEIAVDRHIRNFAQYAGISAHNYTELKRTFQFAADFLEINYSILDKLIWEHMSKRILN